MLCSPKIVKAYNLRIECDAPNLRVDFMKGNARNADHTASSTKETSICTKYNMHLILG